MSARLGLHVDRPARLLVLAAQPGDADLALSGSVARWISEGCVAHLVCCTSGDAGADDAATDPLELAARRESEQRAAAARVGYEAVTFLHRPEGALADDLALREQLVRLIRRFRPDSLAAPDPRDPIHAHGTVLSADMRAAGEAALHALEPARRAMAFAHLAGTEYLAPHAVARLYLYGSDRATTAIDIGATLHVKLAALREHAGGPRSGAELEAEARAMARAVGGASGTSAAEACVVVDVRT